ncbi:MULTISPECIES: hypothetical protein [Amycolatopsis]|nr:MULTISPECIES: hypothetical protein [Amycolatopsis]OAP20389.1 hypothetical protein A4R44_08813 [Amycolatopsis sp. M39]
MSHADPEDGRLNRIERNRRMLESWKAGDSLTEIAKEQELS